MQAELEDVLMSNLDFILDNIDFKKKRINIHQNKDGRKIVDYSRNFFILFALAHVFRYHPVALSGKIESEQIIELAKSLFSEVRSESGLQYFPKLVSALYYLRLINLLNVSLDEDKIVELISSLSHQELYSSPVPMYVFMRTWDEVASFRDKFPFGAIIYENCVSTFEYIFKSNLRKKYLPFHFSELCLMDIKFNKQVQEFINTSFLNGDFPNNLNSSSGVAKCIEIYGSLGDEKMCNLILHLLKKRKIHLLPLYNSIYNSFPFAISEYPKNQYVCLDTNGHLVIGIVNLLKNSL